MNPWDLTSASLYDIYGDIKAYGPIMKVSGGFNTVITLLMQHSAKYIVLFHHRPKSSDMVNVMN